MNQNTVDEGADHVTQVLQELDGIIRSAIEVFAERNSFYNFVSFLERMAPILALFQDIDRESIPPEVQTAVKGMEGELQRIRAALDIYTLKSRIYALLHCQNLVQEMQDVTNRLGYWLSLIPLVETTPIQEIKKKVYELSQEMQAAKFTVKENEARVLASLEREASSPSPRFEAASGLPLYVEIASAIGLDPERNRNELLQQVQFLKRETQESQDEHEKQMIDIIDTMFQNTVTQTEILSQPPTFAVEDDDHMPPFESFLCSLTKQVMKDPVVLETEQTYERSAIENWFKQCREQGREPVCPLSGRILISTELRPNYGLCQTIEEWLERNARRRIGVAVRNLTPSASVEDKERALDDIFRLSEESPLHKYKLKAAGLIPLILSIWECQVESSTLLRSKALRALLSMAVKNTENKVTMVEAGALRFVVKSLSSNLEKEKEAAFQLLFELSKQPDLCHNIGCQRGAILFLSGATISADNLTILNLAEKTLQNLEEVDTNVWPMAEAGRLRPLLTRLIKGSEDIKVKMAEHLAQITLLSSAKEQVAKAGSDVLVHMLSSNHNAKEAGLGALLNLSTLDDNTSTLIKAGILPPLLNIIFTLHMVSHFKLKETATEILANLVACPGHWEVAPIDSEGNTLQSETVIRNLLGLLTHVPPNWKLMLLQVLYGMTSSPQAAETVADHFKTTNGFTILVNLSQCWEGPLRLYTLKLLSILSVRMGTQVLEALKVAGNLGWFKETVKGNTNCSSEEQALAASILGNIPLADQEVDGVLGADLIGWVVNKIAGMKGSKHGPLVRGTLEGLLGVLLHFTRSSNDNIVQKLKEHRVMTVLKEQLLTGHKLVKQRAALGMQILSEKSNILAKESDPPSQSGCFASLMILCRFRSRSPVHYCSVHSGVCDANRTFCLVEAQAVTPLVDLLEENDLDLRITAVQALSTLLVDSVNLRGGVLELQRLQAVHPIFNMFIKLRVGELQEKTLWIVERCLRVDDCAQLFLIDQQLFKALVEAYKHGSPTTRVLAQDGLTHLKRLSGVATKNKKSWA